MSVIKKPDLKIFAQDAKTGEVETFPDILRGWGVTLDRTAGKPPLEWFNAIGKRVDEWLMYLTQRGVAEWDTTLSYPKTAIVQWNGVIYVSNKETKGEQPDKSQAPWSTLGVFLGLDKYSTTAEMNLALLKKIDKANITNQTGNSTELVVSQQLLANELGKKQPKGDYATNEALNNGLNTKLNTSSVVQATGASTTNVMSQKAVTDALQNAVNLNTIYPVGIVVWFAQNKNPNTLFPGTEWQYIGENKTIRLANSNGSNVLTTGGADSISLTEAQMPAHNHSFSATTSSFDYGTKTTSSSGEHTHTYSGVYTDETMPNATNGSKRSWRNNTQTTSSSGVHTHTVAIGAHTHTVSGTTGNKGGGSAITVTNAYVMLMGWYRAS
ncbi:phage baseplate protein [Providencia vermicola]|uniref:phage baseplate protein n=1 Tax=Providencia vermicola TaxID=333965 RepID=UPI0034D49814